MSRGLVATALIAALLAAVHAGPTAAVAADGPTVLHPRLAVQTVAQGLVTPIGIIELAPGDLLVLEKNTGRVQRVVDGATAGTVLDLAVNSASERGLLSAVVHPRFPADPGVYVYWTESTTGADTGVHSRTPLLGNRVDRFVWDGSTLAFDRNITRIRAVQRDAGQPERGNHNGGVLAFDRAGKLLVFVGDVGRRGHLQNLPCGPAPTCSGTTVADDAFGGPEPDDAHLTGVVLRLEDDGTTPPDNPFAAAGAAIGGEVGANVARTFSYGHRNGFGMAVDPRSGQLWVQENGDDSFSELNRVEPGMNGGWVQLAGPVARVGQFKEIETTFGARSLQQLRWAPTNIADTPSEALSRLHMLPGAHYSDPELAWKWEIAPGGIAFAGAGLGRQFDGDLFVGAATTTGHGGYLFQLNLTGNRSKIGVDDPRLADRVADNTAKHDLTESESLLVGQDFGIVPDIEPSAAGSLLVASLTRGAVYEITRR